jgi:hypothetical protein
MSYTDAIAISLIQFVVWTTAAILGGITGYWLANRKK